MYLQPLSLLQKRQPHDDFFLFGLGTKNFADVDLGDRRRTQRLITSATLIAAHPEKTFTQVFTGKTLTSPKRKRGVSPNLRLHFGLVGDNLSNRGNKHEGSPGVQTLWRGYQRLQDLLWGYHLRDPSRKKDVANR